MSGYQAHRGVDSSRRGVLEQIRSSPDAVSRQDLARALGLHQSTIGAHLRALEAAGLICRVEVRDARPGRPALRYRALQTPAGAGTELMELLVASLGDLPGAPELIEQAGWSWARTAGVAEDLQQDMLMDLVAVTDRLGFSPELNRSGEEASLALRSCPVRDVARARPSVVCGMHRGILRGRLSLHPGPLPALDLVPFAAPDVCLVHLRTPDLAEASP